MRPCAVTGVGVVSPLGTGRDSFFAAVRSGASAVFRDGRAETFDLSKYPGRRLAEVPAFDAVKHLGDKGLRSLDRLTKLLLVAAREALGDAGQKREGQWAAGAADSVGLVVSNAYGSLEAITELNRVATLEDARYINPSRFPLTVSNSAAGYVSIWEDLRAVNVTVSDGNCGSLDAVACAEALLSQGRAEALLVGGAEAMSEALFLAFDKLGALSSLNGDGPGARTGPGLLSPSGLCLGEGAALLVLELPEAAQARSGQVLAHIVGYGTSFVSPASETALVHASPVAVERAIREALGDAHLDPRAVDVVVSGVSGLRAFDEAELLGIREVLGADACVVAPKLALGETLGAGGAMAMLAGIALLRSGGRLPVVRGKLIEQPKAALVVSIGYYGNASAVVMKSRPQEEPQQEPGEEL